MIRLENVIIGASNNMLRRYGYKKHTKRYPHERKDIPKEVRVRYHTMKKAGCADDLIYRYVNWLHGKDNANLLFRIK